MSLSNSTADSIKVYSRKGKKKALSESNDPILEAEIKSLQASVSRLRTDVRVIVRDVLLQILHERDIRSLSAQ